jgi:hypothetical protein
MDEVTLPGMLASLKRQLHIIERVVPELEALAKIQGETPYGISLTGANGTAPKRKGGRRPIHTGPDAEERRREARAAYQRMLRAKKKKAAAASGPDLTTRGTPRQRALPKTKRKSPRAKGPKAAAVPQRRVVASPARGNNTNEFLLNALERAGRPMGSGELTNAIIAAGWITGSAEPQNVVGQALYQLKKAKKIKKFGDPGSFTWGFPGWKAAVTASQAFETAEAAAAAES